MRKWRVVKNHEWLGGWRAIGPNGEIRHHDSFSEAIRWVDFQNRRVTVVLDPEYRDYPRLIWVADDLLMFITADVDNAIIATQGEGEFVKIPSRSLPAVARSLLTLYSQYLTNLEKEFFLQ